MDDAPRTAPTGPDAAWAEAAGARARAAFRQMRRTTPQARTRALEAVAEALRAGAGRIEAENAADLEAARAAGRPAALLDRLSLAGGRVAALAEAVEAVAARPDPVGAEIARWTGPSGIEIATVREPLGVIGVIFESRPNVAADAAALCLRAGNACVLRGGSESARSVAAILKSVRAGLEEAGLPADAVQTPPDADRAHVGAMLAGLGGGLDLVIPRGGRDLVARVSREARVPVLGHLDGVCHVFLHADADPDRAEAIAVNSKMRRTGVCNAMETLLVDAACAEALLPRVAAALRAAGCALRGDARARALVPDITPAEASDWDAEYLDAIAAVAVVDGLEGALAHIARHGSGHTEAIVTRDAEAAARFLAEVDAAVVMHDAATGFSDGGEFGFGAEIGIATGRVHARGPVGADQLTTWKHVVRGDGRIRA